MRARERGHGKEAWLGDAERVGQKMTPPLWRPGYGPALVPVPSLVGIAHSQNCKQPVLLVVTCSLHPHLGQHFEVIGMDT